jgi:hypothetical protein
MLAILLAVNPKVMDEAGQPRLIRRIFGSWMNWVPYPEVARGLWLALPCLDC